MIGYLEGTTKNVDGVHIIILSGGVGYLVSAPLPTLLSHKEGDAVSLYIHTRVREDAISLYGFDTQTELELFEKLLSVSGIGPKSGLAMMSVHSPASIADAVEKNDTALLSHTPGIGKKTAEKIIVELRGKLTHLQNAQATNDNLFEVRLALEALGYNAREMYEVLGKLNPLEHDTSKLIKEALSLLK